MKGLFVAEEPNFLFSYNITRLSAPLRRALNRERSNVGRSAYSDRVKAILAIETSVTAFDEIPAEGLKKLAKVPILIVIGDRAQDRVDASRAFQKKMQALGGDVAVDVLPEAGIFGNGHTLMLERNNRQIMDRMVAWLKKHVYGE